MSDDSKIEPYYQRHADDLVTMLFNERFLDDKVSLESIAALKEYVGFIIQSQCQSAVRCAELSRRFKERKATP